ncbi:MAG: (2Fe-2S) ferredoxin domain-containing protein [Synechococcus sp.]
MGHSKLKTRFSVTGRFTRFAIEDGFKIKGFYFDVAGEEILIKAPKRLRYYCADLLMPGATLQISGKKTIYRDSDRTQYKAEDIIPLATPMADAATVGSAVLVTDDRAVGDLAGLATANGHAVGSAQAAEALGDLASVQIHPVQEKPSSRKPACIRVCQKSSCRKRGGDAVWSALETAIDEQELGDRVKLKAMGCIDKCKAGPNVIMPGKMRYSRVKAKSVPGLLEEHFTAGGSE